MSETVLWDYPKSSASYRLRIALNLIGEPYHKKTVNLLDGVQKSSDHLARNPQGLVPVLDIDGQRLTQSLAILEYLNETREAGFLPKDAELRVKIRALAMSLAVDVHPVCNLSVVRHATGGEKQASVEWMHHFIGPGLRAYEALLDGLPNTPFANGDTPGFAEICLVPQLHNANRWGVPYDDCPRIKLTEKHCEALPEFQAAHPDTA